MSISSSVEMEVAYQMIGSVMGLKTVQLEKMSRIVVSLYSSLY